MFERFTEKARRVIFFARYEASQYGSLVIDSEHILLGLVREDVALMPHYVGSTLSATEIRTDLERVIKRHASIPTNVEVPLSADSKNILNFAAEEAERLGHRHIGTEHILLGILRLPDCLAAKALLARGAKPNAIREQMAKATMSVVPTMPPALGARTTLDAFLGQLKAGTPDQLADHFDDQGQFIDSCGKRYRGRTQIENAAETLLAPFAKRNSSFRVEDTTLGPSRTLIASVLWEFAAASADRSKSLLRMSIVLAWADQDWTILLVQITPVIYP
jgi:hypothetical protein